MLMWYLHADLCLFCSHCRSARRRVVADRGRITRSSDRHARQICDRRLAAAPGDRARGELFA